MQRNCVKITHSGRKKIIKRNTFEKTKVCMFLFQEFCWKIFSLCKKGKWTGGKYMRIFQRFPFHPHVTQDPVFWIKGNFSDIQSYFYFRCTLVTSCERGRNLRDSNLLRDAQRCKLRVFFLQVKLIMSNYHPCMIKKQLCQHCYVRGVDVASGKNTEHGLSIRANRKPAHLARCQSGSLCPAHAGWDEQLSACASRSGNGQACRPHTAGKAGIGVAPWGPSWAPSHTLNNRLQKTPQWKKSQKIDVKNIRTCPMQCQTMRNNGSISQVFLYNLDLFICLLARPGSAGKHVPKNEWMWLATKSGSTRNAMGCNASLDEFCLRANISAIRPSGGHIPKHRRNGQSQTSRNCMWIRNQLAKVSCQK